MDTKESHNNLDRAIDAHIRATSPEDSGVLVTGWVLIASVSSPDFDKTSSDGYVTHTSEGLPHHGISGLLSVALEERKAISMISTISSIIGRFYIGNDDDKEN